MTVEELQDGLDFIMSLEADHVIPSIVTIDGDAAASLDQNPKFIDGKYAGILEWDSAPKKYMSALSEGRELVVGDEFTDFGENGKTGVFTKVSLGFAISSTSEHPKEPTGMYSADFPMMSSIPKKARKNCTTVWLTPAKADKGI